VERKNKQERAAIEFDTGLNCAQAVLMAFREELNFPESMLLRLGAGFGGGMARQQMTCGAVTGAYMVIGLLLEDKGKSIAELKQDAKSQCLQFSVAFKQHHGSLICRDMLGYDMNTEEGQMQIDIQGLYSKVCSNCVRNAVKIIEELKTVNS
jgi:C_GCAxxG_C_C family probable redox protein